MVFSCGQCCNHRGLDNISKSALAEGWGYSQQLGECESQDGLDRPYERPDNSEVTLKREMVLT